MDTPRRRKAGSATPTHISFRVTSDEFATLAGQAVGKMSVSDLVKTRVFGGSVRDTTVLRHIAALNQLGRALLKLNDRTQTSNLEADELLGKVRNAIEHLARQLP